MGKISLIGGIFNLNHNPLGLEGVMPVIRILSSDHFVGYSCVDLNDCQLTRAGGSSTVPENVQQLVCNLQLQADAVHLLEVSENNFTGEGIYVLAAFMYICPSLEVMHSTLCGITSDDLKQLLTLLSGLSLKLSKLEQWDLRDNDIDDDGVTTLIQHLSMFPNLKSVNLDSIQVSPGILKILQEELDARRKVHLHCI